MNCKGCYYWRPLDASAKDGRCCHYLLFNRCKRPRDADGKCLAYEKRRLVRKRVWIFE